MSPAHNQALTARKFVGQHCVRIGFEFILNNIYLINNGKTK